MLSELFPKSLVPLSTGKSWNMLIFIAMLMKEKYSHKLLSRLGQGDKVPREIKLLESEEQGAI